MDSRTTAMRPMRDLLKRLPMLPMTGRQEIDFPAADVSLLVAIGDDAETTIQVIHHGIASMGLLMAHSAPVIEDGTVGADDVENLGYLLAELGDLAAALQTLSAQCRRQTFDFAPE
jgi:hypothetical protein